MSKFEGTDDDVIEMIDADEPLPEGGYYVEPARAEAILRKQGRFPLQIAQLSAKRAIEIGIQVGPSDAQAAPEVQSVAVNQEFLAEQPQEMEVEQPEEQSIHTTQETVEMESSPVEIAQAMEPPKTPAMPQSSMTPQIVITQDKREMSSSISRTNRHTELEIQDSITVERTTEVLINWQGKETAAIHWRNREIDNTALQRVHELLVGNLHEMATAPQNETENDSAHDFASAKNRASLPSKGKGKKKTEEKRRQTIAVIPIEEPQVSTIPVRKSRKSISYKDPDTDAASSPVPDVKKTVANPNNLGTRRATMSKFASPPQKLAAVTASPDLATIDLPTDRVTPPMEQAIQTTHVQEELCVPETPQDTPIRDDVWEPRCHQTSHQVTPTPREAWGSSSTKPLVAAAVQNAKAPKLVESKTTPSNKRPRSPSPSVSAKRAKQSKKAEPGSFVWAKTVDTHVCIPLHTF
jgi:hypothetical protein